jgi:hypothetical protein
LVVLALGVAQGAQDGKPTEAEFLEQIRHLEGKNNLRTRLEAVGWLSMHTRAATALVVLPALERCIRTDPDKEVRQRAVSSLAHIARRLDRPCPLVIAEALLDREDFVRWQAVACTPTFDRFAPGCVEVLLRGVESDLADVRSTCLLVLARAAGKDRKAMAALERATHDKVFDVRHSAHLALLTANDSLDEFLPYLLCLREDPAAVLSPASADPEMHKKEREQRNLFVIGLQFRVYEWSETRADELAAAVMKRLADPSAIMRRGTANLIAAAVVKVVLAPKKDLFSPLDDLQRDANKELFKFLTPSVGPQAFPEAKKAPRAEKSKVALRLEQLHVAESLRRLRNQDPDGAVRAAARNALERLESFERGKP